MKKTSRLKLPAVLVTVTLTGCNGGPAVSQPQTPTESPVVTSQATTAPDTQSAPPPSAIATDAPVPSTSADPPIDPPTDSPTDPPTDLPTDAASASPAQPSPPAPGGPISPREIAQLHTSATVHLLADSGRGTGFVIDAAAGIVVTNQHVIAGAATLKAALASGETVPARVLGSAPCEDLAVVQLHEIPESITEVTLGTSADLVSQDQVTAIGFPSSFAEAETQSAVTTSGAVQSPDVSAEPSTSLPRYGALIQHDATINPGNSGGPLFNDRGEVVGINTLVNVRADDRVIQGQYYAIAIDRAIQFIDRLRQGESILDIGISASELSTADLSAMSSDGDALHESLIANGYTGLLVESVAPGGPTDDVFIRPYDLITQVNGVGVASVAQLCDVLASASGDTLTVEGMSLSPASQNEQFEPWVARVAIP